MNKHSNLGSLFINQISWQLANNQCSFIGDKLYDHEITSKSQFDVLGESEMVSFCFAWEICWIQHSNILRRITYAQFIVVHLHFKNLKNKKCVIPFLKKDSLGNIKTLILLLFFRLIKTETYIIEQPYYLRQLNLRIFSQLLSDQYTDLVSCFTKNNPFMCL